MTLATRRLLSSSASLGLAACLLGAGTAYGRNYLIIVADDLGVDKVSSYAHDYDGIYDIDGDGVADPYAPSFLPSTPTVDDLAAHGLRFTRAWAEPVCSPSRTTLHTGEHPFRHGTGAPLNSGAVGFDTATHTTLADFAAANGYATGSFGKWHMGEEDAAGVTGTPATSPFYDAPHPSLAGFDRFYGTLDGDINDYHSWERIEWRGGAGVGTVKSPETLEATERTATVAGNWIAKQTGDWLAVVNFHAPHAPTAADVWAYGDVDPTCVRTPALAACLAAGSCADEEKAVYQGLAECMDIHTEALLASIDDDVLAETLIVFVGDNGTPDDVLESLFFDADGDGAYDQHGKGTPYENGLRVPFVVTDGYTYVNGSGGSITSPGRDVAFGVHLADLYETIHLDMTGASSGVPDSFDFSACFTNTTSYCGASRNFGYSEKFAGTLGTDEFGSVRYGNDKMIVRWDAGGSCLDPEFYDTAADPLETTPTTFGAVRTNRLENFFTTLHGGTGSWADGEAFCP